MKGVRLTAGGQKAETDEKGFYRFEGLPTSQKIQTVLDMESYYSFLVPAEPVRAFELRPGTCASYDIALVETGGIDGFVYRNIGSDLELQSLIIRCTDSKGFDEPKEQPLDEEGFFVVEKIHTDVPYLIEIIDQSGAVLYSEEITVSSMDNWLSGLVIQL
ncbi:MAG: hypothetical protein PHQ23_00090 [Candidatus Wallbacteria bacterium]|nr:hypothetical protein [Candidatus Wallbacteria bacterium]